MSFSKFQAHPWHGISPGPNPPESIFAFIEIIPTDVMKYEVHKPSGHIIVDRPLLYSSQSPVLYGFVPQTYSGAKVAAFASAAIGESLMGDSDPIDICVLTERPIAQGGILLKARPIGGIRMIDRNEADDKILAVLENDSAFGGFKDIEDCPKHLLDRLTHYFLTYKDLPGAVKRQARIPGNYGASEAKAIIAASIEDYAQYISSEKSS